MGLMIGGAAVLLIGGLIAFSQMNKGSDAGNKNDTPGTQKQTEQNNKTLPSVALGKARSGKPPAKPAPELTVETLQKLQAMLDEAKELINDGKRARTGRGDNAAARTKMGEASELLRKWEQMIAAPLLWQEDAEMEDWAQPAAYVTLSKMYDKFAKYQKEARMGGG